MSESERLLSEFIEAYRRDGSTDPREYLARVEGVEREELRLLIEGFLERTPRRAWDPDAYPGSMADRALAQGWPELLPALRTRARLKRSTVIERLASALGFPGSEQRVAAYYHQMERGQLPPRGVSTRVLEALGSILGASAERLRRAGETGEPVAGSGGEVFARSGAPAEQMASGAIPSQADLSMQHDTEPPDELDLLFTGGD